MSLRSRPLRLLAGFVLVALVLIAAFSLIIPWMHTWGATPAELAAVHPGDDILPSPLVRWSNGITIAAPPDKVWPWIAQIGDIRGGFYSFTWIEKLVSGVDYHNANRIIPELQDPKPGDQIIGGALKVREVKTGEYLLADSTNPDMGWTWVWQISPAANGQTRLFVRAYIQPPAGPSNPALLFFMDAGGFVMQKRMIQGLTARAEGHMEPGYTLALEAILWAVALIAGIAGAALFVARKPWWQPLLVGLSAVVCVLVFTYIQPALWLRGLLDLALVTGVVEARKAR